MDDENEQWSVQGRKPKRISEKLRDKIRDFMDAKTIEENQVVDFLELYNFIENKVYKLVDEKGWQNLAEKNKTISTLKKEYSRDYCYKHYESKIIFKCQNFLTVKNIQERFNYNWSTDIKRNLGGVLLIRNKNEIVLVITCNGIVNIPMGKVDHTDNDNLKITSLRELLEETGFHVPVNKLQNFQHCYIDNYNVKIEKNKFKPKTTCTFLYELMPEDKINPDHEVKNEIKGNITVKIDDLVNSLKDLTFNTINRDFFLITSPPQPKQYKIASSIKYFFLKNSHLKNYVFDKDNKIELDQVNKDTSSVEKQYTRLLQDKNIRI